MKITAAQGLLRELRAWGIDHVYGIPGSSLNGMMDALRKEEDKVKYIQVRQEGAGAMAATAETKYTGKIAVAFGSGGPGASNLINGLYDAKMDNVPLLALVAQSESDNQNRHSFQETEVLPLYENVGVYNRKVMGPQQLIYVINDAIRHAYERKGPAIVILHNDFMTAEIDYEETVEEKFIPVEPKRAIPKEKIDKALEMIMSAERPVLYMGKGVRECMEKAVEFSEKFALPAMTTAPSSGYSFPRNHKNYMGTFGRLGTKPGFDITEDMDLLIFVGSNFPFARFWRKDIQIIQVNNSFKDIGAQLHSDLSIHGDSADFFQALLDSGKGREEDDRLRAARINMKNWDAWLDATASDDSKGLNPESVIRKIGEFSKPDALYGLGVGNNTMYSVRQLPLYGEHRHVMSGWFATLGYGLPAGIGLKLSNPDKQVFTISGDGGYAMNMQEILTQTRYGLPIINIVFTDKSFGFIEHSQKEALDETYGIKISGADWAKTAEGMGAIAFTVTNLKELDDAFEEIGKLEEDGNKRPVFVEAKVRYKDPIDTARMMLNPEKYSEEEIENFKKEYEIFDMPHLSEILKNMK